MQTYIKYDISFTDVTYQSEKQVVLVNAFTQKAKFFASIDKRKR